MRSFRREVSELMAALTNLPDIIRVGAKTVKWKSASIMLAGLLYSWKDFLFIYSLFEMMQPSQCGQV